VTSTVDSTGGGWALVCAPIVEASLSWPCAKARPAWPAARASAAVAQAARQGRIRGRPSMLLSREFRRAALDAHACLRMSLRELGRGYWLQDCRIGR
jgi:hypothetical protein